MERSLYGCKALQPAIQGAFGRWQRAPAGRRSHRAWWGRMWRISTMWPGERAGRSLTPTPRPAWNGRLLGMDDCLEWTTNWNAWNALIRRVKIAAPCQRLNQSCLHTSGKLPTNGRLAACAGQTQMHSSNRGLRHVMERSNIEGCWERGRAGKEAVCSNSTGTRDLARGVGGRTE